MIKFCHSICAVMLITLPACQSPREQDAAFEDDRPPATVAQIEALRYGMTMEEVIEAMGPVRGMRSDAIPLILYFGADNREFCLYFARSSAGEEYRLMLIKIERDSQLEREFAPPIAPSR